MELLDTNVTPVPGDLVTLVHVTVVSEDDDIVCPVLRHIPAVADDCITLPPLMFPVTLSEPGVSTVVMLP